MPITGNNWCINRRNIKVQKVTAYSVKLPGLNTFRNNKNLNVFK